MSYKGRALYNLIQMNLKRNPHLDVEEWQVEDYQTLETKELFSRLESHQIFLDEEHFLLYVEESDSPEDLAECLYLDKDFVAHEKIFLCLFELWRRLVPHKQSLSLFCDELDHLIEEYEEGNLDSEEDLQASLLSFQKILDDNVDEGGDAKEGFVLLSSYSCHDLEVFIYEYVAHQLDLENALYASELLDGFYPYVQNKMWFDFLRVRVIDAGDLEEGHLMLERLFDLVKDGSDIHLLFEILHYLVYKDNQDLFISYFNFALSVIESEEDLHELMQISCDYLNCNDREKEEQVIKRFLDERKHKDPQSILDKGDDIFIELKNLIQFSPA